MRYRILDVQERRIEWAHRLHHCLSSLAGDPLT
jgi:hypothetical protein